MVDPTTWISYKVASNPVLLEIVSHLSHKFLRPSLVDTEETCFGMADACIAGGSAGCRLMNFVGDNGNRNDIAALLNGAHDVIDLLPQEPDWLTNSLHFHLSSPSSSLAQALRFPFPPVP